MLLFLASVVPWRGAVRIKRLMNKPDLTAADRLSLYGSTILSQWLMVAVVVWRCVARAVDPGELGLVGVNSSRIVWSTVALTGLLCANQVMGLRKIASLPEGKRGALFAITQKIMPTDLTESLLFAALACTAGLSEEFVYRGFVFMAFERMTVNYSPPAALASFLSSALFSMAHLYQGRRGFITTFVVGMIFALVRVWTGSLIPVIVAHIAIDLVAGILAPRFLRRV